MTVLLYARSCLRKSLRTCVSRVLSLSPVFLLAITFCLLFLIIGQNNGGGNDIVTETQHNKGNPRHAALLYHRAPAGVPHDPGVPPAHDPQRPHHTTRFRHRAPDRLTFKLINMLMAATNNSSIQPMKLAQQIHENPDSLLTPRSSLPTPHSPRPLDLPTTPPPRKPVAAVTGNAPSPPANVHNTHARRDVITNAPDPTKQHQQKQRTTPPPHAGSVPPSSPRPVLCLLSPQPEARLGNLLFMFAAAYSIAANRGYTLQASAQPFVKVKEVFSGAEFSSLPASRERPGAVMPSKHATYEELTLPADGQDFCLSGYFQSWKYFSHHREALQRQLTFSDPLIEAIDELLQPELVRISDTEGVLPKDITMVGVHVRRGDMASPSAGYRTPPPSYYLRAMLYFHARLPHVHFFVVTDDPAWAAAIFHDLVPRVVTVMTSLTQKNPLLAQHGDVVDLAFLARFCDHVVGSVGTFGWWGAWLNGRPDADVVFYDSPIAMDTALAAGLSYEDFFLPHWKLMGD